MASFQENVYAGLNQTSSWYKSLWTSDICKYPLKYVEWINKDYPVLKYRFPDNS